MFVLCALVLFLLCCIVRSESSVLYILYKTYIGHLAPVFRQGVLRVASHYFPFSLPCLTIRFCYIPPLHTDYSQVIVSEEIKKRTEAGDFMGMFTVMKNQANVIKVAMAEENQRCIM